MWQRNNRTYSYEILWRAAHTALDMAEIQDPRTRPDHLSIHSILTAFLAFEGFIKFVGDEIAPEVWKKEREFFAGPEFRGISGKLDYLFSLFQGIKVNKGEEPYQTFQKIKKIRDSLAHNHVLNYTEGTEDNNASFRTTWDEFDTPEKIRPALRRLQELAELIRREAVKQLREDYAVSHLHFKAFEGPIGTSEGTRTTN